MARSLTARGYYRRAAQELWAVGATDTDLPLLVMSQYGPTAVGGQIFVCTSLSGGLPWSVQVRLDASRRICDTSGALVIFETHVVEQGIVLVALRFQLVPTVCRVRSSDLTALYQFMQTR